jgi:uncharacterized protein
MLINRRCLHFSNRCATRYLLLGAALLLTVGFSQAGERESKFTAQPFPLSHVKLLEGPFLHAQELDHAYLLKLEPDRFLAWFRKEAGLKPKAEVYGGWESQGVAGHCLGHYLSACALMYQATGDAKLKRRVDYVVSELAICQKANANGYLAAIPRGKEVFAQVARGEITSKGFDLNGSWVPWYTMHKVMAGLRDSYQLCGNKQALQVLRGMADWAIVTTQNLTTEQWQKMLACEHGGMNEVLADLYAITGEDKYLALSKKFHHEAVLAALAAQRDELNGKHANTQIPKLIGLARRSELTGDTNDQTAAEFFWERVVNHHSYVTGGHCIGEHFGPPDKLNDRLGQHTTETCNVYNMLKLTEHVFEWSADPKAADFYERALYNHILSSQHPVDGRVIYNLSLAMGGFKEYQRQFDDFTCCVGTGMENHAKYGQAIYFHSADALYVNLFIASELNWKERGVRVKQETRFPDQGTTTLAFTCAKPAEFTLKVRHPYWAKTIGVRVNGETIKSGTAPSTFIEIRRQWQSGDKVELSLPMDLRLETMPDNPNRVAVMYGPLVLAGKLGAVNDPAANNTDFVPVLVSEGRAPSAWLSPLAAQPCSFRTENVGRPREAVLIPFFRMHDQRYTVYWDVFTAEQWQAREAAYKAELQARRELEARIVDELKIGEMQPERDHNLQGEKTQAGDAFGRKWRHATDGGWFAFTLKCQPEGQQELLVTYWGGDAGNREFDVLVDGQKVATEKLENNRPGKFYDAVYALPDNLTRGRTQVAVKFQALPNKWAGGVFGVRLLKAKAGQ